MLKPFCFAKSFLYPSNSRANPHALYVDPLILNAVFQFETLFVLDCAGGFTVVIWLETTHTCNPPHYGLWVILYFFLICVYKLCFLPLLLVFCNERC